MFHESQTTEEQSLPNSSNVPATNKKWWDRHPVQAIVLGTVLLFSVIWILSLVIDLPDEQTLDIVSATGVRSGIVNEALVEARKHWDDTAMQTLIATDAALAAEAGYGKAGPNALIFSEILKKYKFTDVAIASHFLDVLFNAATNGGIEFTEFIDTVNRVAIKASEAEVSPIDLVTGLAVLSKQSGITGDEAVEILIKNFGKSVAIDIPKDEVQVDAPNLVPKITPTSTPIRTVTPTPIPTPIDYSKFQSIHIEDYAKNPPFYYGKPVKITSVYVKDFLAKGDRGGDTNRVDGIDGYNAVVPTEMFFNIDEDNLYQKTVSGLNKGNFINVYGVGIKSVTGTGSSSDGSITFPALKVLRIDKCGDIAYQNCEYESMETIFSGQ